MTDIPPPIPDLRPVRPLLLFRDFAIVYGLTMLGGFIIGFWSALHREQTSMVLIATSNIIMSTLGFALTSYFAPPKVWTHLSIVAGIVWLAGLLNTAFGFSLLQWLASGVAVLFAAGVGGVIGVVFRRKPRH
jgi:hypothetical protein